MDGVHEHLNDARAPHFNTVVRCVVHGGRYSNISTGGKWNDVIMWR